MNYALRATSFAAAIGGILTACATVATFIICMEATSKNIDTFGIDKLKVTSDDAVHVHPCIGPTAIVALSFCVASTAVGICLCAKKVYTYSQYEPLP